MGRGCLSCINDSPVVAARPSALTEETLAPFPPCTGTSVNPRGGRELAGADVAAGAGEGAGVCLGAAPAGAEAVPGAGLRVKEMGLLMGPRAITYAWGQ